MKKEALPELYAIAKMTEQEIQLYELPFSKWPKGSSPTIFSIADKVNAAIEVVNVDYVKLNPPKHNTFDEEVLIEGAMEAVTNG